MPRTPKPPPAQTSPRSPVAEKSRLTPKKASPAVEANWGEREIVYVAVGANLGDRDATFSAVVAHLVAEPGVTLVGASSVFETAPVGPDGQGAYLNGVVALETDLAPHSLLRRLQAIEAELGRDRRREAVRWGPREVDLDILFFGPRVIDSPDLSVPHPRAHERAFVMTPLAELAPELEHPLLARRIEQIAAELLDAEVVRLWPRPSGWPEPGPIGAGG